ncbi:hypothetical protein A260_07229 [Pseudomonas syringae pv. actinidiae ICMP 19068]|nr:hypothetical protein A260_07229 [Pseudomonas syringae pv. actinidiae ICMP 19068]
MLRRRDDPVFTVIARHADFAALAIEADGRRCGAKQALDEHQGGDADNCTGAHNENRPFVIIPGVIAHDQVAGQ